MLRRTQLASPREQVVTNAIRELVYHCEMMDAMGCGKDSVMVIHMVSRRLFGAISLVSCAC